MDNVSLLTPVLTVFGFGFGFSGFTFGIALFYFMIISLTGLFNFVSDVVINGIGMVLSLLVVIAGLKGWRFSSLLERMTEASDIVDKVTELVSSLVFIGGLAWGFKGTLHIKSNPSE